MPDPLVVRIMREHKAAILAREEAVMQEMAARWLTIEQALQTEMEALALEVSLMAEQGQVINKAITMRLKRTQSLLWQARAETGKYVNWAAEKIAELQTALAEQGLANAAEAIGVIYSEAGMVGTGFNVLNVGAVENMIGLAGDGTPLLKYLQSVHAGAADGMIDALIDGVARGIHPLKVAKEMANGLGRKGLQQAMNTARTEMLRAYRNASLQQYQESGVVSGYRRISARDGRVCAGCLFSDGMLIESLDSFDEHNLGRCTSIPVVIGAEDASLFENGTDWFQKQSEATQRSILGPGRYEAWQNGASLKGMFTHVDDPTWGGSYVPTPVGQL